MLMKKRPSSERMVSAKREITIVNQLGLHARPAAAFVRHANAFRSEIWLVTAKGRFSALSLIDIMRANLDRGAVASLEAIGPDAEEALDQLEKIIKELPDL
jgi:phosphocarrier protein